MDRVKSLQMGTLVNSMVFIDIVWFNQVGIVCVQDINTHQYKFYIRPNEYSEWYESDNTEEQDTIMTIKRGNRFPDNAGKALFDWIDFDKDFIDEHPELFI